MSLSIIHVVFLCARSVCKCPDVLFCFKEILYILLSPLKNAFVSF